MCKSPCFLWPICENKSRYMGKDESRYATSSRCCMATFLFYFKNFDQIALKISQLISGGGIFQRHLNFGGSRCLSKGNRKIFEKIRKHMHKMADF